jgi:hypothetical protein
VRIIYDEITSRNDRRAGSGNAIHGGTEDGAFGPQEFDPQSLS